MKEKCWRKGGCPFNSNNSLRYMKCWQDNYSVGQCSKDNKDKWGKIDNIKKARKSYENSKAK